MDEYGLTVKGVASFCTLCMNNGKKRPRNGFHYIFQPIARCENMSLLRSKIVALDAKAMQTLGTFLKKEIVSSDEKHENKRI